LITQRDETSTGEVVADQSLRQPRDTPAVQRHCLEHRGEMRRKDELMPTIENYRGIIPAIACPFTPGYKIRTSRYPRWQAHATAVSC
jgi:hypothetical protein